MGILNSVQEMIIPAQRGTALRRRPSPGYFFKVSARKLTVRLQASEASSGR